MIGRALYGCRHPGCRQTISVTVDDGVNGTVTPEIELRHVGDLATGRRPAPLLADGLTAAAAALGWTSEGTAGMNCPGHRAV